MDRKAEEEPIAELLAKTTTPRGALRRLCSKQLCSRLKIHGTRLRRPELVKPRADAAELWIRFLSGPDIDGLGLTNAEIIDAVEGAVRAHGEGRAVVEPRVHLIPDHDGAGDFNVLRGHLPTLGVAGVKVVGDFVANYTRGLPSELGLLTLYDP